MPPVKIPVGFTQFPGERVRTPRTWVEQAYLTLTYFNELLERVQPGANVNS